jgi:hypothetical protein
MSFKSREKKRRRRAAIGNVRTKHGEVMKSRHYLTITKRDCCCNECGKRLRRGGEMIFRFEPKEVLCKVCAERREVKYRVARRWDRNHRKRQKSDGKLA